MTLINTRGHAGNPNTGNSHFSIKIKSVKLSSLSRVAGQRLIYDVLQDEMNSYIRAFNKDSYLATISCAKL